MHSVDLALTAYANRGGIQVCSVDFIGPPTHAERRVLGKGFLAAVAHRAPLRHSWFWKGIKVMMKSFPVKKFSKVGPTEIFGLRARNGGYEIFLRSGLIHVCWISLEEGRQAVEQLNQTLPHSPLQEENDGTFPPEELKHDYNYSNM